MRALGWAGDSRDRRFLEWKHRANPSGSSPGWVAEHDGRIVGFRTFMRWELGRGDERLRVVRAVDTATDPDHQRRGIFRALTLQALDALAAGGVEAVFNTPNPRSLAGYLSMGWSELGRPTLLAAPRSAGALGAMVGARTSGTAAKWSEPVTVGQPAGEALDGHPAVPPGDRQWSTVRTEAYLRWRYAFPELGYRAVAVRGGTCVFRVRQRGRARELALCEWLSPVPDPRAVRRLLAATGADYVVTLGRAGSGQRLLPLPRRGPAVVWRPLSRRPVPRLADLDLAMGDVELL